MKQQNNRIQPHTKTCASGVSASSQHRQPRATPKNGKIVKSYSGVEVTLTYHKLHNQEESAIKRRKSGRNVYGISDVKDGSPYL